MTDNDKNDLTAVVLFAGSLALPAIFGNLGIYLWLALLLVAAWMRLRAA